MNPRMSKKTRDVVGDLMRPEEPKFRDKAIRALTITLLFLIMFFSVGFFGVETTTSSKFCSSCHEMVPEFYTWRASSHSEVDCIQCHTGPNPKGYAKAKTNGLVKLFSKREQVSSTEKMSKKISDRICENCHNLTRRQVTPSGDLIIPHDKHKTNNIGCIQCHSGIAHGNITARKMTLLEDYGKWNAEVGHAAMKDQEYIKPSMETCIECHKLKSGPIECTACHKTGMYPESHHQVDFKYYQHGKLAKVELESCHECHSLMSRKKVLGFEKSSTLSHFLKIEDETLLKNQSDYAKENTFCRDCHTSRPAGHTFLWMLEHGGNAIEDAQNCFTCHGLKEAERTTNTVTCIPCHSDNDQKWLYLIRVRE
jgi:nitrate/TMAO reductase-like tetraheme cytochrome c subunit